MNMTESKFPWRIRHSRRGRGQSIVEFALMAPILLILLSGLFEFGFIFTHYLAVLDSARNAARFSSDSQYDMRDGDPDCDESVDGSATQDFYRYTACMAMTELLNEEPTIELCLPNATASPTCDPSDWDNLDDIIISVFSVLRGSPPTYDKLNVRRFPEYPSGTTLEAGWSYAYDQKGYGQGDGLYRTGMHVSEFSTARIISMLQDGVPSTGYVLVEIKYHYHQILGLPWFTQFVADPILFDIYAIWPLVSAEPTSTLKPATAMP
jgi:hypothetical protein